MKNLIASLFILLLITPQLASCSEDNPELPSLTEQPVTPEKPSDDDNQNNNDNNNSMNNRVNIRIGNTSFSLTLKDNATATAFKALLPLTLNMADFNDNEKLYNLSTNLPTSASRPGTIHTGDLMLFGSNCLVLFYKTFPSSYSYTSLGSVDSTSKLSTALGSGSITVTFEITDN